MYINNYESKKKNNLYKILSFVLLQLSILSLGIFSGSWLVVANRLTQLNDGDQQIVMIRNVAIAFTVIFAISTIFLLLFFYLYKTNKELSSVLDIIKSNAKKFESMVTKKDIATTSNTSLSLVASPVAPALKPTTTKITISSNNGKPLAIGGVNRTLTTNRPTPSISAPRNTTISNTRPTIGSMNKTTSPMTTKKVVVNPSITKSSTTTNSIGNKTNVLNGSALVKKPTLLSSMPKNANLTSKTVTTNKVAPNVANSTGSRVGVLNGKASVKKPTLLSSTPKKVPLSSRTTTTTKTAPNVTRNIPISNLVGKQTSTSSVIRK